MFKLRFSAVLALLFFSTVCAFAQTERGYEVFVGYSLLKGEGLRNTNDFLDRRATLHGVNADATLFAFEYFGITGDLSFNRTGRSVDVASGTDSEHTDVWYFMGGPSLLLPASEHLQPFARLLVGGAHTTYEAKQKRQSPTAIRTSTFGLGTTNFAMGFGGGVDVKVGDRLRLRAIQVDYAPIFLSDRAVTILGQAGVLRSVILDGQRQDNWRFSFGVTF